MRHDSIRAFVHVHERVIQRQRTRRGLVFAVSRVRAAFASRARVASRLTASIVRRTLLGKSSLATVIFSCTVPPSDIVRRPRTRAYFAPFTRCAQISESSSSFKSSVPTSSRAMSLADTSSTYSRHSITSASPSLDVRRRFHARMSPNRRVNDAREMERPRAPRSRHRVSRLRVALHNRCRLRALRRRVRVAIRARENLHLRPKDRVRRFWFRARGDFRRSRHLSTARSPFSGVCDPRVFIQTFGVAGAMWSAVVAKELRDAGAAPRELERVRRRGRVRFHRVGRVRRPRVRTTIRERVRGFEIGEVSRETRGRDGDERAEEVRARARIRVHVARGPRWRICCVGERW